MGPQKYKNEQISVGHFCGKRAMGAKKMEILENFSVGRCFFCGISVGGHKKKHRPTELFTPFEALYKTRL